MPTRVVTAQLPDELAEQVDRLAARLDRPKGWIVPQALTAWVELETRRHQLTLDGLADVDAGRVVEHASAAAWARSLESAQDNGMDSRDSKSGYRVALTSK